VKRLAAIVVTALIAAAPAATAAPLKVGSRGSAVKAVQQRLGVPADGVYGHATARAVRRYQRTHGLRVTGRVNRPTKRALGLAAPTTTNGGTGVPDSMADAVRAAVGRPYEAGAAGPDSFDCSGLVVWAAAAAGIDMPRSSFAQYDTGLAVARDDLAPGDLVFFDTNGPGPSDVGIVVGPDAAISATTHGVREHSIAGYYWGEHYVGARRFR
jgi:cell wall-associated NlpC family hydrolase